MDFTVFGLTPGVYDLVVTNDESGLGGSAARATRRRRRRQHRRRARPRRAARRRARARRARTRRAHTARVDVLRLDGVGPPPGARSTRRSCRARPRVPS
ncbi:MAG: hypothetical protein H6828_11725 [Planctomycetes bacterium]|nr:hypothetical protein [Planctomycetota bacterium]